MPSFFSIATNIIVPVFIIAGLAALIDRHFRLDARALWPRCLPPYPQSRAG